MATVKSFPVFHHSADNISLVHWDHCASAGAKQNVFARGWGEPVLIFMAKYQLKFHRFHRGYASKTAQGLENPLC